VLSTHDDLTSMSICVVSLPQADTLEVAPCELLDAILQHAIREGDEEELFENLRVHENTMALYMDLQMEKKITVDNFA